MVPAEVVDCPSPQFIDSVVPGVTLAWPGVAVVVPRCRRTRWTFSRRMWGVDLSGRSCLESFIASWFLAIFLPGVNGWGGAQEFASSWPMAFAPERMTVLGWRFAGRCKGRRKQDCFFQASQKQFVHEILGVQVLSLKGCEALNGPCAFIELASDRPEVDCVSHLVGRVFSVARWAKSFEKTPRLLMEAAGSNDAPRNVKACDYPGRLFDWHSQGIRA